MSEALISLTCLALHKGISSVLLYLAQRRANFSFMTATFLGEVSKLIFSYSVLQIVAFRQTTKEQYVLLQQSPTLFGEDLKMQASSVGAELPVHDRRSASTPNKWINKKRTCSLAGVAVLYVAQNNAYLYASSQLRPTLMQAVWQLRVITTAIASALILKRRFTFNQILGMAILICSVLLINNGLRDDVIDTRVASASLAGLGAAFAACSLSGLAGVLIEAVLKDENTDLWMANCQMSIFSLLPAAACVFFESREASDGPSSLQGFTSPWAWTVVFVHGLAGLLVAFATKYASSVAKSFSGAYAIIITLALSSLAGTRPGPFLPNGSKLFVLVSGVATLYLSTWLYSQSCEEEAYKVEKREAMEA